MATEYERPSDRTIERHYATDRGSGMGVALGIIAALAIVALLFFAFYDRTPSGPSTATSSQTTTAPERTVPKTPVAPPATTPSTK